MPNKPLVEPVPAAPANYSKGRRGQPVSKLVIHTMQGTYGGTRGWFTNPAAQVSAHYAISYMGSICQFVDDGDTAWHAGNLAYNRISIGIELEGFMERGYFPDPMMAALATLCKYLCATYSIALDRLHIIGHNEVPDPTNPALVGGSQHHKDPGPNFPWETFMTQLTKTAP